MKARVASVSDDRLVRSPVVATGEVDRPDIEGMQGKDLSVARIGSSTYLGPSHCAYANLVSRGQVDLPDPPTSVNRLGGSPLFKKPLTRYFSLASPSVCSSQRAEDISIKSAE